VSKSKIVRAARSRFLAGIGVPEKQDFVVDDFQREAVLAVADNNDTLVVAPTGAGKTYIALEAISIAMQLGCRAIYTTPLKALSNTKYTELKKRFEPGHSVGLLTGDRKIDVDADVVVATTEIYRNELYREYGKYSIVVLDEVHFIADVQRGPVWEESIILTPTDSTLLMLSASISNSSEIAKWIEDVRGKKCRIIIKKDRPVELRLGFLHPELGVLPLRNEKGGIMKEVSRYYGSVGLDSSGMKLRGGKFARPRRGKRGSFKPSGKRKRK
jgi:ATP-dependent RNA helicase HelY